LYPAIFEVEQRVRGGRSQRRHFVAWFCSASALAMSRSATASALTCSLPSAIACLMASTFA
jgi:hypothetical protein